jgi:hypothetical protein
MEMHKSLRTAVPISVWWLVLLSFLLQVAAVGAFHQYRTRTADDHFAFGW